MARTRRLACSATLLALGAAGTVAAARLLTGGPDSDLALPGDVCLPGAPITATQGLDIKAPAEAVWPWLVQMGADRAGFYTLTALENLAGLGTTNGEVIEPAWQDLAVGDQVRLSPEVSLGVAVLDPGHALVLSRLGGQAPSGAGASTHLDLTWAFTLLGTSTGCRLIVRERYAPHHPAAWVAAAGVLPLSRLLTRAMLTGVRRRVLAAQEPVRAVPGDDDAGRVPADPAR